MGELLYYFRGAMDSELIRLPRLAILEAHQHLLPQAVSAL